MVDLSLLPITTLGGAIGLLIDAIIAFIVIMLVNKVVAHNIDAKHSFLMAIIALFITPIVVAFASLEYYFTLFIIPLIVWVILGEILLSADAKTKLKVIIIAFVVYTILTWVGLPMIVSGMF